VTYANVIEVLGERLFFKNVDVLNPIISQQSLRKQSKTHPFQLKLLQIRFE